MSTCVISPHSRLNLLSEAFFAFQGRSFLRLELSHGTIAAEIGQAVVDLKLEVM